MRDQRDESALQRVLARAAALAPSEDELASDEQRVSPAELRERLETARAWSRLDALGRAALVRDELESTRALELTRAWLLPACSRPALVLVGDPGVGKTLAAAWSVSRFEGSRYATARELVALMRDDTKGGVARWRAHLAARLLVVDELGTESNARAATAMVWAVIDARQTRERLTLLAGNLDIEAMAARYDGRVMDRLGARDDDGIALVRLLCGPSLRARSAGSGGGGDAD